MSMSMWCIPRAISVAVSSEAQAQAQPGYRIQCDADRYSSAYLAAIEFALYAGAR